MNKETILWILQLIIRDLIEARKWVERYKDDSLNQKLEKIDDDLWVLRIAIDRLRNDISQASTDIGLAEIETWVYVWVDLEDILKRIK